MTIIVQKFGGSSIATTERINHVAQIIKQSLEQGNSPVIIVSAMAGVTNNLVALCLEVSSLDQGNDDLSEYDTALSSGEMVTASLLALSLQKLGIQARSFCGWQLPITTDNNHSKALIKQISCTQLHNSIQQGVVPIISGFQGVNDQGRISTLGRGGSDTSATAIAGALQAERCEIFTDTDGVYTADPRLVDNAQLLAELSFDEMLEFSKLGAKVLHPRAVQIAQRNNIPIQIISSFSQIAGTIIRSNKNMNMEQPHITGIAVNNDVAICKIQLPHKTDKAQLLQRIAFENVNMSHIQSETNDEKVTLTITLPLLLLSRVKNIAAEFDAVILTSASDVIQIAIVGIGLDNNTETLQTLLTTLQNNQCDAISLESSTTNISCLIESKNYEKIVQDLHDKLIK